MYIGYNLKDRALDRSAKGKAMFVSFAFFVWWSFIVQQHCCAICQNLPGDSCLLSDIVWLSGISKQTINSSLRKLERDGILYLENADGKKKRIYLTQAGKNLAENSALRVMKIEDEIFSFWSGGERETYFTLMERFLSSFKEKVEKPTIGLLSGNSLNDARGKRSKPL